MKYMANYIKSMAFSVLIVLAAAAIAFAAPVTPTTASLTKSMGCLCGTIVDLMPAICILLIMAAGVVYAGGQVGGAELRAKAQGYATAMVMGAVIGIIMSIVLPAFINTVYASTNADFCKSSNCTI